MDQVPAIFRLVTNGVHYSIQRKASIGDEWKICTYMVPTSDFSAARVPFTYLFKWMARWKMCRLMLEEFQFCKLINEKWEEVDP